MKNAAWKVGLGLALGFCLVCGIGGFVLFRIGLGKATEIVGKEYPEPRTFVAAVREGRLDDAYELTTPGYQKRVSRQAFGERQEAYVAQLADLDMGKPSAFLMKAESGSPNRTELTYGNAGETKLVRFTLVEGRGGSKIDAITRVK